MDRKKIVSLLKNDLTQYRKTKKYVISSLTGLLSVLIAMLLIIAIPLDTGNIDTDRLSSVRSRNPTADDGMAVWLAVAETVIPGLLLMSAALSPGFLALSVISSEKEQRTVESLFLLPVSDIDILISKVLSSVPVSVAGTWIIYLASLVFTAMYHSTSLLFIFLNWKIIIEILLLVPALSIFSALGGTIVSMVVSDTRAAMNMAFIPGALSMFIAFLLIMGDLSLSVTFLLLAIVILIMLDVVGFGIAISCFKREKILLRY